MYNSKCETLQTSVTVCKQKNTNSEVSCEHPGPFYLLPGNLVGYVDFLLTRGQGNAWKGLCNSRSVFGKRVDPVNWKIKCCMGRGAFGNVTSNVPM